MMQFIAYQNQFTRSLSGGYEMVYASYYLEMEGETIKERVVCGCVLLIKSAHNLVMKTACTYVM